LAELHRLGRLAQIDKLNFEEAVKAGVQKDDVLFTERPSMPGTVILVVTLLFFLLPFFFFHFFSFFCSFPFSFFYFFFILSSF
jgi:hypothetical protein